MQAEDGDKSKHKSDGKKRDDQNKKKKKKLSSPPPRDDFDDLIGLDLDDTAAAAANETDALLTELASLDFGDFQGGTLTSASLAPSAAAQSNHLDLFQADFDQILAETERTDDSHIDWNSFLPSKLMSHNNLMDGSEPLLFSIADDPLQFASQPLPPSSSSSSASTKKASAEKKRENKTAAVKKEKGKDMSAWYNLFADLDPLANPDAINSDNSEEIDDRNC